MQQQSQIADNSLVDFEGQYADNQAFTQNISTIWDELKDSLYLYSVCSDEQMTQYHTDVVNQTEMYRAHLEDMPDFIYDLYMCKLKNRNNNPWLWQAIMQDHYMQSGLMTVSEDYFTPLHDYNNLAVISYVIDGQIKLTHYQDQPSTITPYYPIARLVKTQEQIVRSGDTVITSPNIGNILEIQSLTEKAVILTIHLVNSPTELGAWYFPISPKPMECHEVFFAQRIRRSM